MVDLPLLIRNGKKEKKQLSQIEGTLKVLRLLRSLTSPAALANGEALE